jgi:hypothetical protein
VLDFNLNKITMSVPVDKDHPEKGVKKQSYDLTASDYFWAKNASLPFPNVADDVTTEWNKYQEDADSVTKRTGTSSIEDLNGESNQFAAHLKGAMALLPELRERKATIEVQAKCSHLADFADTCVDAYESSRSRHGRHQK